MGGIETIDPYWWFMTLLYYTFTIPSGKRLHNELENHHFIAGKINYFDWAIFNSYKLPEGI